VSAPEAGVALAACPLDIIELAARRGAAGALGDAAARRGAMLAPLGQRRIFAAGVTLCVRPGRWLVLSPPAEVGQAALRWQRDCAGSGTAVDLSSALKGLYLCGAAMRELLARGCRVNLAPGAFAADGAAATLIAQVSVIVAALPPGLLLLTPATTARHLYEWLVASGRPFGLRVHGNATVERICEEGQA
jgi:heterotetrameric sarcosine oxidase gamma subunit